MESTFEKCFMVYVCACAQLIASPTIEPSSRLCVHTAIYMYMYVCMYVCIHTYIRMHVFSYISP
jgi:hypothetical protein